MNYQRLIEFRFLREMTIIYVVRESGLSIQKSLQLKIGDIPNLKTPQATNLMKEFIVCRNDLFTNIDLLFPTGNGTIFLPSKFKQNLRNLLKLAEQSISPSHPKKITMDQIHAILDLKFQHQRPKYQQVLAAGLLGFQALRAGEVANLRKEDVDIDRCILWLRETKSQETQRAPIHKDLVAPLESYIKHLKNNEYLFIRNSNKPWTRKDVRLAVRQVGDHFGVGHINPRKLRSTVAHQMISIGVPMNVISEFLRHKDKATAPRHYTPVLDIEIVRQAMSEFRPYAVSQESEE